jgi:arylsulfatase
MSRPFSALLSLCVLAATVVGPAAGQPVRPHLIVILADDLGWSDLGCYGSEIPTPHLDALAAGGMKFSAFYNGAQCCPTRASLISGMYPHEAGVGDMIDAHSLAVRRAAASPHYSDRLDPRAKTVAEHLRAAGYQTYMTGKWHLGYADGQRPLQRNSNPNETRDLAAQHPDRVAELIAKHTAWAQQVGVIPREQIAARLAALPK